MTHEIKMEKQEREEQTFKTVHYIDSGDDDEEIKEGIALITT